MEHVSEESIRCVAKLISANTGLQEPSERVPYSGHSMSDLKVRKQ